MALAAFRVYRILPDRSFQPLAAGPAVYGSLCARLVVLAFRRAAVPQSGCPADPAGNNGLQGSSALIHAGGLLSGRRSPYRLGNAWASPAFTSSRPGRA